VESTDGPVPGDRCFRGPAIIRKSQVRAAMVRESSTGLDSPAYTVPAERTIGCLTRVMIANDSRGSPLRDGIFDASHRASTTQDTVRLLFLSP